MKAFDFEYDGIRLSDMGYMICTFDENGLETKSNGSQITFNKISTLNGKKFELVNAEYEECLETTFQICKNPCEDNDMVISIEEFRDLNRWLNRREFHKLKILDDVYYNLYFEGSFNISRIESNGEIVGLELQLETNRPFALEDPVDITVKIFESNTTKSFNDISDEEGYIYPITKIKVNQAGNLSIYNEIENRYTIIKNCVAGEIITMNYPIIQTSSANHKIQDDFNWNFFRIANKFSTKENKLTVSLPCTIDLEYSPIVKIGL